MTGRSCHICGSESVLELPNYSQLSRVTSDNKPWSKGGRLAWCADCDCAQAVLDGPWQEQAAAIYHSYDLHLLSCGHEQSIFDANTGKVTARSELVLKRLAQTIDFPTTGRLLDIGCGTG